MSNKKKIKCIVHYKGLNEYSELKPVSDQHAKRIMDAKLKREELKGDNHHKPQCDSIPAEITANHVIHSKPCYKKFTQILKSKVAAIDEPETVRRFSKRTANLDPAWLYPRICGICDKVVVKYKGKNVPPSKIATTMAANTFKEAAKAKDFELYAAIASENIVSREFQFHRHCYRNFTRKRKSAGSEEIEQQEENVENDGNDGGSEVFECPEDGEEVCVY